MAHASRDAVPGGRRTSRVGACVTIFVVQGFSATPGRASCHLACQSGQAVCRPDTPWSPGSTRALFQTSGRAVSKNRKSARPSFFGLPPFLKPQTRFLQTTSLFAFRAPSIVRGTLNLRFQVASNSGSHTIRRPRSDLLRTLSRRLAGACLSAFSRRILDAARIIDGHCALCKAGLRRRN